MIPDGETINSIGCAGKCFHIGICSYVQKHQKVPLPDRLITLGCLHSFINSYVLLETIMQWCNGVGTCGDAIHHFLPHIVSLYMQ